MIIETVRDLREALAQWDPELKVAIRMESVDEDGCIRVGSKEIDGLKRSPGVFDRTLLLVPGPQA